MPAAAGPAPAAAAAPVEEEKTEFDVKLTGFDAAAKIKVIKEVRAMTSLGLKEAKELVRFSPWTHIILLELSVELVIYAVFNFAMLQDLLHQSKSTCKHTHALEWMLQVALEIQCVCLDPCEASGSVKNAVCHPSMLKKLKLLCMKYSLLS